MLRKSRGARVQSVVWVCQHCGWIIVAGSEEEDVGDALDDHDWERHSKKESDWETHLVEREIYEMYELASGQLRQVLIKALRRIFSPFRELAVQPSDFEELDRIFDEIRRKEEESMKFVEGWPSLTPEELAMRSHELQRFLEGKKLRN